MAMFGSEMARHDLETDKKAIRWHLFTVSSSLHCLHLLGLRGKREGRQLLRCLFSVTSSTARYRRANLWCMDSEDLYPQET